MRFVSPDGPDQRCTDTADEQCGVQDGLFRAGNQDDGNAFSESTVTTRASSSLLPFAHLNLRRNPFGEFSVEDWTRLADVDLDEFDELLAEPGSVLQFVGDKGYGKTTHLLAIGVRFPGSGYVHIPEGERAEVPGGNPVLIDEAQRLTWRQRRQVFRSSVPLVLGTHRDFTRELTRAGRRVRTVAAEDRMNATRLTRILNSRIEWVRRGGGPVPGVLYETAAGMLERFGPNIRRIQLELYMTFQDMNDGIRDV